MPPRRRAAQSASKAQPKLSFNSKPNKITKPDNKETPIGKKVVQKDAVTLVPETAEIEQPAVVPLKPKDKVTLKAESITDKQIKEYWQREEKVRKAPRVHQEDLSVNEKILRHFDLCSQYGPCIGILRLKRWRRAENLGLKPPVEVLAVMLKEEARADKENDKRTGERAHLDELMNPRL